MRLDVLAEVAAALRVSLSPSILLEDEEENDDVPAIRDALMAPRRLSRTLFSSSISPEYVDPAPVARLAETSWSHYQKGELGQVVAALPGLIKTAQKLEAASVDDGSSKLGGVEASASSSGGCASCA